MAKSTAPPAYGSSAFQELSVVVQDLYQHHDRRSWATLFRTAVRGRRELWTGVSLLRSLPCLEVCLSNEPAGRAIRDRLGRRVVGVPARRVARASLCLPDDAAAYLRGRHKQAVRTNLHRAEEAGIRCRQLVGPREQEAGLAEFVRAGGWGEDEWRCLAEKLGITGIGQDLHVAEDDRGIVALAALEVDATCAYMVYLKAIDGPASGPARYALSVHVVRSLIQRDVDVLLVGNAVRLSPGLQYFQQRLGFEVCNVRLAAS